MSQELFTKFVKLISQKHVRVAIMLSGGGSNAEALLKARSRYPNVEIVALITDQPASNAKKLAAKYHVKYHCQSAGKLTPVEREAYFQKLSAYLRREKIECLIYAGL